MTRRVGSGARMAVVPFTERLPASARPQAGAVRFTSQHGDVERGTLGALQARAGDLQRVPVPELVDAQVAEPRHAVHRPHHLGPGQDGVPEQAPVVPDRDGHAPLARVMVPVNLVTVFPEASRALTGTAGVIVAPASVLLGCTVKPRCVAAGGGGSGAVMSNGSLVAPVRPDVLARRV